MNSLKKIISISIIIILFIGFSFSTFAIGGKNPNIDKAKKLISEKKFNEASQILMEEFVKDEDNEDIIMELLTQIEKEKEKILNVIGLIKQHIEDGNFDEAEKILSDLEDPGDFDSTINTIIKTIEQEQAPLEEMRKFNDLVLEAENYLVEFRIKDALQNYTQALDVYRHYTYNIQDDAFLDIMDDFNALEKRLLRSDIGKPYYFEFDANEYNVFLKAKRELLAKIKDWRELEEKFVDMGITLHNSRALTKEKITYRAYNSINTKYLSLIRRKIQKYSHEFITGLFTIIDEESRNIDVDNPQSVTNVERLFTHFNDIERFVFYNLTIDFDDSKLFKRSKLNLSTYLEYLTRKNYYILQVEETKAMNYSDKIADLLRGYRADRDAKAIFDAGAKLDLAIKLNDDAQIVMDKFLELIQPYQNFNHEDFSRIINNFFMLKDDLEDYNDRIREAKGDHANSILLVNTLLKDADEMYAQSLKLYRQRLFKQSEEKFNEAKIQYFKIDTVMKSEQVDKQIERINKYLAEIEEVSLEIDMQMAENHLERSISFFYAESFFKARDEIFEAEKIYNKYNQESEEINNYRARILSAIKIQSGSILSIDDPLYEEISELFTMATYLYDQGQYKASQDYINQILVEKPYYEKAKRFEVKNLRQIDPGNFEKIYNEYYKKAKTLYDNGKYDLALQEFQQLLPFELNVKNIKSYIYQCKVKLNLIKTTVTTADKNKARQLVNQANALYINQQIQEALTKAEQALARWEDVPGAREIRLKCRKILGIQTPKLTTANEKKFFEATDAYGNGDYEKAYKLTNEILKTQKFDKVVRLNKKADIQRKK